MVIKINFVIVAAVILTLRFSPGGTIPPYTLEDDVKLYKLPRVVSQFLLRINIGLVMINYTRRTIVKTIFYRIVLQCRYRDKKGCITNNSSSLNLEEV